MSRYGGMALSWTMDKIGPICRARGGLRAGAERDLRADGRDDTVVDAPFAWNPDVPLGSLKIGYLPGDFEPTPRPNMTDEAKKQFEARAAS